MPNSRAGLTYGYHAVCTFSGAGGGGAFLRQRGFAAAFVRNGAGDYSLALTDAIDTTQTQYGLIGTPAGAAAGTTLDASIVDATHIRVRTGVAAVLTDMIFTLLVIDLGVN